jgi:glucose-1-phosphate thymidylyltransferase
MTLQKEPEIVGIVPAAGAGSRLAPYPGSKELFPIGHQLVEIKGAPERRPKVISQYLLDNMVGAGIRKLYLVIGHGKYDIVGYYGNGESFGASISYLFQSRLDGMPYALDLATPWLPDGATVAMGMPDTIIEPQNAFSVLISAHQQWGADLTLGLFRTDKPSKFGMVGIDGRGNVVEHVDKPAETDLEWLWGMACWGPRFTSLMHTALASHTAAGAQRRETVLGDMFDLAIAQGLVVKGVPFDEGRYIDIGTYDDLKRALLLYT